MAPLEFFLNDTYTSSFFHHYSGLPYQEGVVVMFLKLTGVLV